MIQFLLVFAAVLIVARWVSGHLAQKFRAAGHNLEVIESLGLGARRILCLVRAGDKYLVLGITDQAIRVLGTVEDIEEVPQEPGRMSSLSWFQGRGDGRD